MDNAMLGKIVRMIVTVPAEWLGTLGDLLEKLTGAEGSVWLTALKRFLRKENQWAVFPIWRTITLGLHPSVVAYTTVIESANFKIGDYARQMLAKMAIATEPITLELFSATTAELGFINGATFAQICARIKELGYEFCPAEVGPAARIAYPDQPNGEWRRIVMETITDSGGDPSVFNLGRDGGLWLDSRWIDPDFVWGPAYRWVFGRSVVARKEVLWPWYLYLPLYLGLCPVFSHRGSTGLFCFKSNQT